jgi:hypothetical protein
VAPDFRGQVVLGSGHWLMEEAPQTVILANHRFYELITGSRKRDIYVATIEDLAGASRI